MNCIDLSRQPSILVRYDCHCIPVSVADKGKYNISLSHSLAFISTKHVATLSFGLASTVFLPTNKERVNSVFVFVY